MVHIQKAVIMARGLGTRMRKEDVAAVLDSRQEEAAGQGIKAMIPLARPFLDYVLSEMADAGYSDVCLVIGPEHTVIREYYRVKSPPRRIRIHFAIQEHPLGTADAVLAAREFTGQECFLTVNSDNFYPAGALSALREMGRPGVALFDRDALVSGSNVPEDRILKFAVARIGPNGRLDRLYEKPSEETVRRLGTPLYVSMNCWVFSPRIYEACSQVTPSPRGELELSDAIQFAIDNLKEDFNVLTFRAPVLDMSSRADIAAVAKILEGTQPDP
jgi:dTDP-glucose pyrophosphorylase